MRAVSLTQKVIFILATIAFAGSCKKSSSKVKDLGDTGKQSCDEITYMFESSLDEYYFGYKEMQKSNCSEFVNSVTPPPRRGLQLRNAQDRNNADVAFPALAKASASTDIMRTETITGMKLLDDEDPSSVVTTPACLKLERYMLDLNRYIRKAVDSYAACVNTQYGASKTKILDYPGCSTPCLLGEKSCFKCSANVQGAEGDNGSIICSTKLDGAFQVSRWCNLHAPGKCSLTFAEDAVGLNGVTCTEMPYALEAMGTTLSGTTEETVLAENQSTAFTPLDLTIKAGFKKEIPLLDIGGGVEGKVNQKYMMSATTVQAVQFLSRAGFPFAFDDPRKKVSVVKDPSKECVSPVQVQGSTWANTDPKSVCNVVGAAGNDYWCAAQKINTQVTSTTTGVNVGFKIGFAGIENNTSNDWINGTSQTMIAKGGLFRGSGKAVREIKAQCSHWLKTYISVAMETATIVSGAKNLPQVEIKIPDPRVKCTYANGKNTEIKDFFIFVKKDAMEVQYRRHTDALSGAFEKPLVYIVTHGEVPATFSPNFQSKTFTPAQTAAFLNEALKPKTATSGEWAIKSCSAF